MQFKTTILSLAGLMSLATATEFWSVKNFNRDCTNPNICNYYFTIDTGKGLEKCTVFDYGNPATTHSWYNYPCNQPTQNPNYHISWGWSADSAFTVMTVVNEVSQKEAFFGYNHPNTYPNATLPDVGPNAVQPTGVVPSAAVV